MIRGPKLVVYGLDHLFGLNLSSGIYLMYILIVNIVCIYVLWMYILIHFQKIVGYSWEYPGIQLPPPMAKSIRTTETRPAKLIGRSSETSRTTAISQTRVAEPTTAIKGTTIAAKITKAAGAAISEATKTFTAKRPTRSSASN